VGLYMGNKIFKKTGISILFCISICYGQGIGCTEINEMKNTSLAYKAYLGSFIKYTSGQVAVYQSTFSAAYAKRVIISLDSSDRETSMFFYFDYFKDLNAGKPGFEKIKKKMKSCLKGYKILMEDNEPGVLGCAFYSKNEDDDNYWILGIGELTLDAENPPNKIILFLAFVQEWE
jgi:hypothetical protein